MLCLNIQHTINNDSTYFKKCILKLHIVEKLILNLLFLCNNHYDYREHQTLQSKMKLCFLNATELISSQDITLKK